MAIRFKNVDSSIGLITVAFDGATGHVVGVFNLAQGRTGVLASQLANLAGYLPGTHQLISARSGTINRQLDNLLAQIQGPSSGSPSVSPTLWQDYSGRAFAGEPGALAVNNAWASTVYDYVPRFAPTIPTIPVFTNAAHQVIVNSRTALANALGNNALRHFFVQKGTDMHGQTDITINNAGTAGNPRWILYYDPADVNKNLSIFKPWNLAVGNANRAQMCRLSFDTGAANYYIVGLNAGKVGAAGQKAGNHVGNAHDIVWYRCSSENAQNGASHAVASGACTDITFFECVNWKHNEGAGDIHGFSIGSGTRIRVVSCEGGDQMGDFCQFGNGGTVLDCALEDCDIYNTRFTNNAGGLQANGDYVDGEGGLDCKAFNGIKAYGNRIWAMRETANTGVHGPGSGSPLRFSNNGANKRHFDARWNVIDDSTDGGILLQGAVTTGTVDGHHSVVRNIVNNVRPTGGNRPISVQDHNSEGYLNTISNCPNANASFGFQTQQGGPLNADIRGNLLINVPAMSGTGDLAAAATVGQNAYLAPAPVFNKGMPGTDQTSTTGAANMGNFTYRRKKLTAPENATINGIVPTSATPAAIRTMVPFTGAGRLGNRAGLGVDDVF